MALSAAEAERAEFSGRRGDHIARSWTRTSGGTAWDAGSELVQIRAGSSDTSRLVATSNHAVETGLEFQRQVGHQGEVFDAQRRQHGYSARAI